MLITNISLASINLSGLVYLFLCMDHIWIECVSQSIANKVDCHHGNEDHQAWKNSQPRGTENMDLCAFKDISPAGCGWLDSKPQVAQTRFSDDGIGHFQGCTDKQGTNAVWQYA